MTKDYLSLILFPFSESTTEGYRIRWWELISSKYLVWTKNAIHHISKQRMLQPSGPCSHSCKSGTLRRLRMRKHRILASDSRGAHQKNCYREEPILTPRWIYFFDFSLCYSLFLSGNPAPLPECQTKVGFFQLTGRLSDSQHLWMVCRKEDINKYPPVLYD